MNKQFYALTKRQAAAFRERFGGVLDLKREYKAAVAYIENVHVGRPYKNFGRFFWNWCRRAEDAALRPERRVRAERRVQAAEMAATAPAEVTFTREQLTQMLDDELASIREFARIELERIKNA